MVYEGKPSQGCGTCRKRRIKCDQQRPVCGQCIKSKRECLGYRDQSELMFVDVNKKFESKTAGKGAASKRIAVKRGSSSDSGGSTPTIPQPLSETAERQALSFFFSEFVALPRHQEAAYGYLEYLLPLYADAGTDSPLFDATAAAAVAALSRRRQSAKLMMHSHIYYGKAVTMLQNAIGDPRLAASNETLMSIMMLGLFEAMTANQDSVYEWGHHADGAAALVQFRGREAMLQDPMSRKLYWSVRIQNVFNNLLKCEPMEPFLDWENLWETPLEVPDEKHGIKLAAVCTRVPALRAAGNKWLCCPMSAQVALKCVDLMCNAKVIDQLLASWAFEAPTVWRSRTVGTVEGTMDDPESTFLYPGVLYAYSDLWISNTWNFWRTMRTVCNALIVNCLERLYPAEELPGVPEYQTAISILQNMANGLCASVPYHLGHAMPDLGNTPSPPPTSNSRDDADEPWFRPDDSGEPDRAVKTLGAYYLHLPLFVGYTVYTLSETQRAWMRGRLLYVANTHGSGQARVLADMFSVHNRNGRTQSMTDFAPPPYTPYPDIWSMVQSHSFRNMEAIADLRAVTPEARVLRSWRAAFLKRLLDIDVASELLELGNEVRLTLKRKRDDGDEGEGRIGACETTFWSSGVGAGAGARALPWFEGSMH